MNLHLPPTFLRLAMPRRTHLSPASRRLLRELGLALLPYGTALLLVMALSG